MEELFEMAALMRKEGQNELVPCWIFEPEKRYKVRRYTPFLPFNRENEHLRNLKWSLVAYRMVLGQPRQEDLVNSYKIGWSEI
jgi:hypothetical protein